MKNKLIFIVVLILSVSTAWILGKNTKIDVQLDVPETAVEYQVNDIKALQTNDLGDTEYTLEAQSLSRNEETNEEILAGVNMNWEPVAGKKYEITSNSASFNQETGKMIMNKGFTFIAKVDNGETITIIGDSLQGNTKMKQVVSKQPIKFKQGNNKFSASAMTADLTTGEYEFDNIEVIFDPSERVEESIF